MVLPVIPIAVGLSAGVSTVAGLMQTRNNKRASEIALSYQKQLVRDNRRFWDDYYKNTGYRPNYRYRSGYLYNPSQIASYKARIANAPWAYAGYVSSGARSAVTSAYGYMSRGYNDW